MAEECGNCRFWKEVPRENSHDGAIGKCRRHPPRVQFESYGMGGAGPATQWPRTLIGEWCGEYQGEKHEQRD